jgi:hypothetical protein
MRSTRFHIRAAFRWHCPRVQTVALLLHAIFIIRTTFERCCLDVRTDAAVFLYTCLWRKSDYLSNSDVCSDVLPWRPNGVALTSGRTQLSSYIRVCEGNLITCRTLMCVRTCCHDVRTDATLNCSNILDNDGRLNAWLGRPDGILGFDFSKLEFVHNLLWVSWNILSDINGILDKMATLHNSDFVK